MAKNKYSGFRTWNDFFDTQPYFEVEGIETHYTRGSGHTKHRFLNPNVYVDWIGHPSQPPPAGGIAYTQLAIIEKDARRILDRAGLLKDSKEDYTLPAKWGPWGRLLDKMANRQYLDMEWYAARILAQTSLLRYHIATFSESAKAPKVEKTKTSPELIEKAIEFHKWSSKKRTPQEIGKKFEKEFTRIARKYDDPFVPTIQQIVQQIVVCAMMLGGQLSEAHIRFGSMRANAKEAGMARGNQQTRAHQHEWEKLQAEADQFWKIKPHLSTAEVARMIKEKILKKEGRAIGLRTITNRIRKPSP